MLRATRLPNQRVAKLSSLYYLLVQTLNPSARALHSPEGHSEVRHTSRFSLKLQTRPTRGTWLWFRTSWHLVCCRVRIQGALERNPVGFLCGEPKARWSRQSSTTPGCFLKRAMRLRSQMMESAGFSTENQRPSSHCCSAKAAHLSASLLASSVCGSPQPCGFPSDRRPLAVPWWSDLQARVKVLQGGAMCIQVTFSALARSNILTKELSLVKRPVGGGSRASWLFLLLAFGRHEDQRGLPHVPIPVDPVLGCLAEDRLPRDCRVIRRGEPIQVQLVQLTLQASEVSATTNKCHASG